ncbi:MAG: VWA domain-containing protein [Calditrichaeota bacterium]|nr:MAG: VWA domain-containing protein [Calditrichota bacterium]
MFIGVDISGSFVRGGNFDDSINFLANYIYAHLNGNGGLEVPRVLFVGSIGGAKADEPKTFFPIQTFENKSIEEIKEKLVEIFPKDKLNPFTDYNAFFQQVALTVKKRNLILRPISIVMISDGIPDVKKDGKTDFRSLDLKPLENLSRNVTVRVLYTNAVVGQNWQTTVKRRRVKIWTQDDEVMTTWKDPKIFLPDTSFAQQDKFFAWVHDNVDFGVRAMRVD